MLVAIVVVALLAGLIALVIRGSKAGQSRGRLEARAERRRIEARDWWVRRWLFGNRGIKRLTDQRDAR